MPAETPNTRRSWLFGVTVVVPLVLLGIIGVMTSQSTTDLTRTRESLKLVAEMKLQANLLLGAMIDNETGQRGYILAQDPVFLEPYDHSLAVMPPNRRLLAAEINEEQGRALFAALCRSMDARLEFSARTVELQRQGNHEGSVAMVKTGRGKALMDQARRDAAALIKHLDDLTHDFEEKYTANVRWDERVSWMMVAADGFLVVMLILLLLRLRRTQHFVSVCAWSKTVEFEGEWISFEEYLSRRFGFSISHGISPAEAKKMLSALPGREAGAAELEK